MVCAVPHYLLFSESDVHPAKGVGYWKFNLQQTAGSDSLEVMEFEPCIDGERLMLLGVLRGLEALDQPSAVTIVTPSRYVARGFRSGIAQWKADDWCCERFGAMKSILYADLWKRIERALQFHQVDCRCWTVNSSGPEHSQQFQPEVSPELPNEVVVEPKKRISPAIFDPARISNLVNRVKTWSLQAAGIELVPAEERFKNNTTSPIESIKVT